MTPTIRSVSRRRRVPRASVEGISAWPGVTRPSGVTSNVTHLVDARTGTCGFAESLPAAWNRTGQRPLRGEIGGLMKPLVCLLSPLVPAFSFAIANSGRAQPSQPPAATIDDVFESVANKLLPSAGLIETPQTGPCASGQRITISSARRAIEILNNLARVTRGPWPPGAPRC